MHYSHNESRTPTTIVYLLRRSPEVDNEKSRSNYCGGCFPTSPHISNSFFINGCEFLEVRSTRMHKHWYYSSIFQQCMKSTSNTCSYRMVGHSWGMCELLLRSSQCELPKYSLSICVRPLISCELKYWWVWLLWLLYSTIHIWSMLKKHLLPDNVFAACHQYDQGSHSPCSKEWVSDSSIHLFYIYKHWMDI